LKLGTATSKALGDAATSSSARRPRISSRERAGHARYPAAGGSQASRLIVGGRSKLSATKDKDFLKLGGAAAGKLGAGATP